MSGRRSRGPRPPRGPSVSEIALSARTSLWRTVRRGLQVAPEITQGLWVTVAIALVSTAGRVVVPVAVQLTIDRGIRGPHGARPGLVLALAVAAAAGVLVTAISSYVTTVRIFRSTEAGLATLRVAAFRH